MYIYFFVFYFCSKILIWSLYFFLSQFGSYFGKFDLNLVISVSGTVTTLNGVPRVSSWIFYFLFYFFDFFLKIKKIATCQAIVVPRGSDNVTC